MAEIRMFPYDFAPRDWAFCDGQLLPISQNTALFSLLGTTYGGDGKTTFALPNLAGSAPMHPGQGPGLTPRRLGDHGGAETVTLQESQMPAHNHEIATASGRNTANNAVPDPTVVLAPSANAQAYSTDTTSPTPMSPQALRPTGQGAPHDNMQPYLPVHFCIALRGIFPPRP